MAKYSDGRDPTVQAAARRARGRADDERRSAQERLRNYYAQAENPKSIRERRQASRKRKG